MTVSYKDLERTGVMKRADARKIRLEDIHEEPGFNLRDYDAVEPDGTTFADGIRELAEFMAAGGIVPPLEVRIRPEGGVFLVDGHRRTRAYQLLDSEGRLPRTPKKDDPKVLEAWISVVPFEGNDVDRKARVITSAERKDLKPLELAKGYKQLAAFGLTPEQIAQKVNKKVPHVKAMLDLANKANADVQAMVKAGEVSPTVAVATVRKHGEQAGAVLGAAKAASAKGRVTDKVLKPRKLPEGLVDQLIAAATAMCEDARQGADSGDWGSWTAKDWEELVALEAQLEKITAWREV